jgi:hypothetical protein
MRGEEMFTLKSCSFHEVRPGPKTPVAERDFFRQPLLEGFNLKYPLMRLAALVNGARRSLAMNGRSAGSFSGEFFMWVPSFTGHYWNLNWRKRCPPHYGL